MSGFFVNLWNVLYPKQEAKYPPEILEAAEICGCGPSRIMWCDTCKDWHEDFIYGPSQ